MPSIGDRVLPDHEVASAVSSKHVNDSLTSLQQGCGELDCRLLPLPSRSNTCHHGVLLGCGGTNEHEDGGTGARFWFQTVVSQGRRAPPPTTDQELHSTRKGYPGGPQKSYHSTDDELLLFSIQTISSSPPSNPDSPPLTLHTALSAPDVRSTTGSKLQCDTHSLFSATESACRSPQKPEHHLVWDHTSLHERHPIFGHVSYFFAVLLLGVLEHLDHFVFHPLHLWCLHGLDRLCHWRAAIGNDQPLRHPALLLLLPLVMFHHNRRYFHTARRVPLKKSLPQALGPRTRPRQHAHPRTRTSPTPRPAPSSHSGGVRGCRRLHVTVPCTEPALPSPPCGSCYVACYHEGLPLGVQLEKATTTTQQQKATSSETPFSFVFGNLCNDLNIAVCCPTKKERTIAGDTAWCELGVIASAVNFFILERPCAGLVFKMFTILSRPGGSQELPRTMEAPAALRGDHGECDANARLVGRRSTSSPTAVQTQRRMVFHTPQVHTRSPLLPARQQVTLTMDQRDLSTTCNLKQPRQSLFRISVVSTFIRSIRSLQH